MTAHPPSSAEVKERVELYFYSPSGSSWPVIGWTLPYLYLDCSFNSFAATFSIGRLSSSFAISQPKLRKHNFKSGFVCQMASLNAAVNLAKWLLMKVSAKLLQIIYSILCLWLRASLIYINNCPTRWNKKQSIYYSAATLEGGSCKKYDQYQRL